MCAVARYSKHHQFADAKTSPLAVAHTGKMLVPSPVCAGSAMTLLQWSDATAITHLQVSDTLVKTSAFFESHVLGWMWCRHGCPPRPGRPRRPLPAAAPPPLRLPPRLRASRMTSRCAFACHSLNQSLDVIYRPGWGAGSDSSASLA